MKKKLSQVRSTLSLMSQRKGTHVGVVISFVIFVTFLVFLYSITQPAIKTRANEQNLLNYLTDDLIVLISGDMTTVSVGINGPVLNPCLKLNSLITRTEVDTNIIVKNDSGDSFDSYLIGSASDLGLLIDGTGSGTTFFKVRVAEEFTPISSDTGLPGCGTLTEVSGYTIGSIRTDEYIFESKIKDLIERYRNDYIGTKKSLNMSTKNDFGFSFTYSNGTTIKTQEVNVSAVIYAEEVPVQYIDTAANITSGILNIKLW